MKRPFENSCLPCSHCIYKFYSSLLCLSSRFNKIIIGHQTHVLHFGPPTPSFLSSRLTRKTAYMIVMATQLQQEKNAGICPLMAKCWGTRGPCVARGRNGFGIQERPSSSRQKSKNKLMIARNQVCFLSPPQNKLSGPYLRQNKIQILKALDPLVVLQPTSQFHFQRGISFIFP